MSFSARQRHCLEAMGLVAWTNGQGAVAHHDEGAKRPAVAVLEDNVVNAGVAGAASVALGDTIPSAAADLAQWLGDQPLVNFDHHGVSVNCVGPDKAPLLVVCLLGKQLEDEPLQLPMSAECVQLFELMMRAVNLTRNGLRQCVAPVDNERFAHHTIAAENVSSLFTAGTKAVLVLDPTRVNPVADASGDSGVMPDSSLPVWCVPHPQQLLHTPQLKRRAWEALKSLQKVLVG